MDAVIRYHLKVNPAELSDDEYTEAWSQVEYVLSKINEK